MILPIPRPTSQMPPFTPRPLADVQMPATLDGITYLLCIRWNARQGAWYLVVEDGAGESVVAGSHRLVVDAPLYRYQLGRGPPGIFVLEDTSGAGLEADFDALGERCLLHYLSLAELRAP
jgi:hypothetical protein